MQKHVFDFLGRRIELWTHAEPDLLARAIRGHRTFYEIDVLMKCREIHLPGTTILDIGANIGNHAVFFAAILDARVHAFEPFPPNQELLELNVAANSLEDRVTIHRCALGEQVTTGATSLGLPNNLGTVSVSVGAGDVPVHTIDSLRLAEPVGLLKVDVEGAECAVLRGAAALIRRWLPDIMVEAGDPDAFQAVARLLLESGYVPRGRYAWTPTYLFSAADQQERMNRLLSRQDLSGPAMADGPARLASP